MEEDLKDMEMRTMRGLEVCKDKLDTRRSSLDSFERPRRPSLSSWRGEMRVSRVEEVSSHLPPIDLETGQVRQVTKHLKSPERFSVKQLILISLLPILLFVVVLLLRKVINVKEMHFFEIVYLGGQTHVQKYMDFFFFLI